MDYSGKISDYRLSSHNNFSMRVSSQPRFFPSVLHLNSVGYQYINYQATGLHHESLDFGIVLSSDSGKYIYSIDGSSKAYTPPLFLVKGPGNVYGNATTSFREVLYFSYSAKMLSVFNDLGLLPGTPGTEFSIDSPIIKLSLEIINHLDTIHQHGELDRIEKLCEMILLEASILKKHSWTIATPQDEKIEEIASYINSNYKKKINISEIISKHGFSKRSFYREWNRKYSVTPYEYLESLRMSLASNLICTTPMRIGEVAAMLNYDDSLYFSKRFKEAFKISPRDYRKKFGSLS